MPSSSRQFSLFDRFIHHTDDALRTIAGTHTESLRANPAGEVPEAQLSEAEKTHTAGLMRVNHTGEVCAQALYQGQALTARLPRVRKSMESAAKEEEDHLAWCEERLRELDSHPSVFNPAWYVMSFGIGAAAGFAGDKWSLGFVEETEVQVCAHLSEHLENLPPQDTRSHKILSQMHKDEAQHAQMAKRAGAASLPKPIKKLMSSVSKVMTSTAYKI
ncbi:demethoxyubiquinone hydroxylase family protein [Gammaproteobacteria bacterium 45_16_T64]|nr:demethoxyubiquinone hydroxylase family protein [Gammaproteobacteria bacterium 45_16_T64]